MALIDWMMHVYATTYGRVNTTNGTTTDGRVNTTSGTSEAVDRGVTIGVLQ